jgi:3-phenylpropionate/trans-cinnamate dioxygenase ferredoxin subunit
VPFSSCKRSTEGLSISEDFVKIGPLNDFPVGSKKKIQVKDEDIFVANLSGKIYAISDTCTHRGCSLSEGEIQNNEVVCPCHSGRFDLTTGKVIGPPPKRDVSSYEVQLQGSDVLVKRV